MFVADKQLKTLMDIRLAEGARCGGMFYISTSVGRKANQNPNQTDDGAYKQMRFEAFHSLWLGSNYCLFMHLLLLPLPLQPKK